MSPAVLIVGPQVIDVLSMRANMTRQAAAGLVAFHGR